MAIIINRSKHQQNKAADNRQRFLDRHKSYIEKKIKDSFKGKSITKGLNDKHNIIMNGNDTSEPSFHNDPHTGNKSIIQPGNPTFSKGDVIPRPKQSGGIGGHGGEDGNDDFIFQLDKEEFIKYLFEDFELPNYILKQLTVSEDFRLKKKGITKKGLPLNIHIVKSLSASLMRKIASKAVLNKQLEETDVDAVEEIDALVQKKKNIPWLDDLDIRYKYLTKEHIPVSKAVMFLLLDVSGSLGADMKDRARRFFYLLYLFLTTKYKHVDVVFLIHTTAPHEVSEKDFFFSTLTGGTEFSSSFELIDKIIQERYDTRAWNVYLAQASDGDIDFNDRDKSTSFLIDKLLPIIQYYIYVNVPDKMARNPNGHWTEVANAAIRSTSYCHKAKFGNLLDNTDILNVLKLLFRKSKV